MTDGRKTVMHVVDLPVPNPWLNGVAQYHDANRFRHMAVTLGPRTDLHLELEQRDMPAFALSAAGRWSYPAAIVRLARLLRDQKVDIVQTHLFWPSLLGLAAGNIARIPVKIVTRHHSDFTTTFDHPWHRRLDRLQALISDRVMAASAAVKRDMMRYERVPEHKISVARYGYDFDVLRPTLTPERRRALRDQLGGDAATLLVTVARLSRSKGHQYLFDAVPAIIAEIPSVRFVLVGTGPRREELEREVERRQIGEHVSFLGWRADAHSIIEAADLVVHPSLHEAFCSVIIETMALGRPLVATSIAAAPEQIDNGESGLLVPPRDGPAIASAVLRMLEDPALAARLAAEGQRRVRARFSFAEMMPQYEAIYDELLSGGPQRVAP